MLSAERSQLKTGQRPSQRAVRVFKPAEVLFAEGSQGRELCIIEEGSVGVYKQTPDGEIELAVLGKGSVLGEMSLLDNLPRSATVRATTTTSALMINEAVFKEVMQKVPMWLNSIIKIVVSRLRDANKRVNQTVLRDRERGLVSLLLLLLPSCKYSFASSTALGYEQVALEAYYVCRLKKKDIARQIELVRTKGLVIIEEDEQKNQHLCFADIEALQLYEEYLNLKSQKKTFKEATVSAEAVTLLSNIAYVAQKSGRETPDGTELSKKMLAADLQSKERERMEKNLLDLRRRGLVNLMAAGEDVTIIFQKDMIVRLKKVKEWLPRFEKQ
jgi:CRP-like cAMP-binding protein